MFSPSIHFLITINQSLEPQGSLSRFHFGSDMIVAWGVNPQVISSQDSIWRDFLLKIVTNCAHDKSHFSGNIINLAKYD